MQFSLKTMMIAICLVAVICAVNLTLPLALVSFVVLTLKVLVPSALVTGILYGDSDQRAFSIGASASFLTVVLTEHGGTFVLPSELVVIPVAVCLGGWSALKTRVWLARRATSTVEAPPVARTGAGDHPIDL
ncbi:MAG: hypothetical protein P8N76_13600 [Pirellulaceae bacterium]|nr:hypothetical protein [Pirellulaceae bacterium]